MQVGDPVAFTPSVFETPAKIGSHGRKMAPERVQGVVVYIHPQRRFYIAEYTVNGYKLQETLYFNR